MDYIYGYLVFLAEAVTVVVAIIAILAAIAAMNARRFPGEGGHLEVRKLNDSLDALRDGVRRALLDPGEFRKLTRRESKARKQEKKRSTSRTGVKPHPSGEGPPDPSGVTGQTATPPRRTFVVDFKGDLYAHAVKHLRTEITAILTTAEPGDEVMVRLESPGGAVHGYGLAASQLDRVQQHGIRLVAAVDKVAASGGYMMAAVADHVLAAPFALVGSIGVIAQVPNVHRLLKKHDVDVEVLTAGKYKRTLTVLGENTEEGRRKFIEELEDVHALFQEYVAARRPALDMSAVATGEAWYGKRALDRKLVDEIATSDEYLTRACADRDVYHVRWVEHKKPIERLLGQVEGSAARLLERLTRSF